MEKLVADKKIEREWVEKFREIDRLWKAIDHREVKDIDAEYLQKAMNLAKEFIDRFKKLIPRNILGEELPEIDE